MQRPTLKPAGTGQIILDGRKVFYHIKRSPQVRQVRFEIRAETGLTVVIPRAYKINELAGLLPKHQKWILGKLEKYEKAQSFLPQPELKNGDTVLYLGQELKIIELHQGKALKIWLAPDGLVVNLGSDYSAFNLDTVIYGWFRWRAQTIIKARLDELCSVIGVSYNNMSIRRAKTRWGSCSRKKNLNFNWKLLMMPQPVIDYVIVHELTHLKEMNHSPKFWALVEEYYPRWREQRKWLKDHEAEMAVRQPV